MRVLPGKVKGLPKDSVKDYFHSIKHQINANIGNWAILREKDGRNIIAHLIQITSLNMGKYMYYDNHGNFVGYLNKNIDLKAIMNNDAQIVFLDM